MSVEAAAHTHSRHRDYGVACDLDVLIGQAGRHEPHSLKPRRAPPTRHHPNAPVVILIPRNARAPERAGGSISCGPKFTNIHGEHQPFWKSRTLGRVNHWSLVASNRLKALPQIDAVIQRLLPLLIARCLIQTVGMQPTSRQRASRAESPFNTSTICATLVGSIVRPRSVWAHDSVALSWCRLLISGS